MVHGLRSKYELVTLVDVHRCIRTVNLFEHVARKLVFSEVGLESSRSTIGQCFYWFLVFFCIVRVHLPMASKSSSLPPQARDTKQNTWSAGEVIYCVQVNNHGNVLLDTFVKPAERVTDYRTHISGIRARDLQNAPSFRDTRTWVIRLLRGSIVVGHSLHNDFKVRTLD